MLPYPSRYKSSERSNDYLEPQNQLESPHPITKILSSFFIRDDNVSFKAAYCMYHSYAVSSLQGNKKAWLQLWITLIPVFYRSVLTHFDNNMLRQVTVYSGSHVYQFSSYGCVFSFSHVPTNKEIFKTISLSPFGWVRIFTIETMQSSSI